MKSLRPTLFLLDLRLVTLQGHFEDKWCLLLSFFFFSIHTSFTGGLELYKGAPVLIAM